MSKRKIDNANIEKNTQSIIQTVEKIFVIDNHFYFNGLIDDQNLLMLKSKINEYIVDNGYAQNIQDTVVDLTNCIVIHINSVGGYLNSILKHIDIFNRQYKIVTIIENRVCDCGLLFAALSNKRFIKQQGRGVIRAVYNNYWYLFRQCEIDQVDKFNQELIDLFIKASRNKLTRERVIDILTQSQELSPKKIKRIFLIDEII